MSQSKMDSLKDSEGKIPSLANQFVITEDENNSENYYKAGSGIKINNGVISSDTEYNYATVNADNLTVNNRIRWRNLWWEGNGIKLNKEDGIISSAPAMMYYKMTSEMKISAAATQFKIPCSTAVSSSNASGKLTTQSDGSIKIGADVSLVRVSANFQFYVNTIATLYGYIYKNESNMFHLCEQLKDSSYRNIPMSISSILIEVSEGDNISIRTYSSAGTNNGVQRASFLVEVVE